MPTVSRCLQHCYNIVPHCRDIWETMFDPCSNRILINLVTVVKCWQDRVLLIYKLLFVPTNKKCPKRKLMLLYTSVYVCDNSCLGTILLASILNKSERVVREQTERCSFRLSQPVAEFRRDVTDAIGCQQVRAHYVAASIHVWSHLAYPDPKLQQVR